MSGQYQPRVMKHLDKVVAALRSIRLSEIVDERRGVQKAVLVALQQANIGFEKEAQICGGGRVDFLCVGGVAIECKQQRPNERALRRQVKRYMKCSKVKGLVVVSHRMAAIEFESINSKPIRTISLNQNWGVALG